MTTAPAHTEPSVVADGFLGIAFRRLREGLLPYMREVLDDDSQTETVSLNDTADVHALLKLWLAHGRKFSESFTPDGRPEHDAGRNWPEEISEFRSEKWAHQEPYTDDEVLKILYSIVAMLDAVGADSQAGDVKQLVDELEACLSQHSHTDRPEVSATGNGTALSPAEIAAGQAISTRPDEPDVFSEGFLAAALRRLGEGLGPHLGVIPDKRRDVGKILSDFKKVPENIRRQCSNLEVARNRWAHQGAYKYYGVQNILAEIIQVLRAIPADPLAVEVDRMRDDLTALHIRRTNRGVAPAAPDFGSPVGDVASAMTLANAVAQPGGAGPIIPYAVAGPRRRGGSPAQSPALPYPFADAGGPIPSADAADDYYRRGDWQNAIDASNEAIAHNPTNAAAYLIRSRARGQLGNRSDAAADYAAAINFNPGIEQNLDLAYAFYERAQAAEQRGEFDQAIASYTQAIAFNPQFANAYYYRGHAYVEKGEYGRAAADFDAVCHINPQNALAYNNLGAACYYLDDYDRAIASYGVALRINPQDAAAYSNRGAAYDEKGEYDLAIADFGAAIRIDSQNAGAYHNRGNAYADKGEYDLAIADYDAAISIDSRFVDAYRGRGNAYADQGDYDRAIADFDTVIGINPRDADAYHDRGLAYASKAEYDSAIVDYDAALVIDPENGDAYHNRGLAYANKGEYGPAIADFDAALRSDPHDADTYAVRGLAYAGQGEYNRAIADYDAALHINPDDANACHNRGIAHFRLGEYDLAVADFDAALRINPQDALAYLRRGLAYDNLGDYDQAIADFDAALRINPQSTRAYDSRGLAYTRKNDYERAIANFDAALRIDPNNDDIYFNRGLAYACRGDYDPAIADFSYALNINPGLTAVHDPRGLAYYYKGEYAQAIADWDAAIEFATDDETLQTLRANRERAALLRDANAELDRDIASSPDNPDAWRRRALFYRDSREDYARAIADFTEALRLNGNPDNAAILYDRALAYELAGDDGRAMSDYASAVAIKPDYSEACYALGIIRTRRREYREAIADFDQAIAHNSAYALAYQRRGVCHYRLGNEEQAHADFSTAARLGYNP